MKSFPQVPEAGLAGTVTPRHVGRGRWEMQTPGWLQLTPSGLEMDDSVRNGADIMVSALCWACLAYLRPWVLVPALLKPA